MNRIVLILALIFLSTNTFAKEPEKYDYASCFEDGGIYAQTMWFEDGIRQNYEVLKKIEKLKGTEIEEVKELLINRINSNLSTLGSMIEDIEKGKILSAQFYEHVKKQNEELEKIFEENLGKEKYSELTSKTDESETKFWRDLKNEREMKNWKVKYKNEKLRVLLEKQIGLALDTYIKYGNIFRME